MTGPLGVWSGGTEGVDATTPVARVRPSHAHRGRAEPSASRIRRSTAAGVAPRFSVFGIDVGYLNLDPSVVGVEVQRVKGCWVVGTLRERFKEMS